MGGWARAGAGAKWSRIAGSDRPYWGSGGDEDDLRNINYVGFTDDED